MPFSDSEQLLRDIVDGIGMIESFTAGMDLDEFCDDPKTVAAVERKLQVISEAAIRLGATPRFAVQDCHGRIFEAWAIGCVTSTSELSYRSSGRRFGTICPFSNRRHYER